MATGALRPRAAVAVSAVSAVLNLVGAFVSVEVARTISGGLIDDAAITMGVITLTPITAGSLAPGSNRRCG
jgi:PiT family inorganic phosphate transporter